MRNTLFNGQIQTMNFPDDYPDDYPDESLCGKPKGMKQILRERQLLRQDLKGYCQNKESEDDQCCMRHMLAKQPDFLAQKCMIQEIIEVKGHKIIFYPKFHCELNFIGVQQKDIQEIIVTILYMEWFKPSCIRLNNF